MGSLARSVGVGDKAANPNIAAKIACYEFNGQHLFDATLRIGASLPLG